jgi:hypothetical protein
MGYALWFYFRLEISHDAEVLAEMRSISRASRVAGAESGSR